MEEARERAEYMYRKTWGEFKEYLSNNPNFLEDGIELWKKESTFFKQFDDAIQNCLPFLERKGNTVSPFYRGTGIDKDIAKDDYSRMIPNPKHIHYSNRMSPPGIPYLYVTPNIKNDKTLQLNTIVAELRAEPGQYFTICSFYTNGPLKLVNLLGDPKLPVEENEIIIELIKQIKKHTNNGNKQAEKLLIQLYFMYFNEDEVFKPIPKEMTEENKAVEYRPFQAIAKYFEWLGYDGLIYKSTVYEGGINTVIFDAKKVKLNEDSLEKYIVPQDFR